ncbi:hypothetical protein J6590_108143, partial [Homalodisca vitripennis]
PVVKRWGHVAKPACNDEEGELKWEKNAKNRNKIEQKEVEKKAKNPKKYRFRHAAGLHRTHGAADDGSAAHHIEQHRTGGLLQLNALFGRAGAPSQPHRDSWLGRARLPG